MNDIKTEKSPGADLPFYLQFATGDAAALYAVNSIASLEITDWDDQAITGIGIVYSFLGSRASLRITGGTNGVNYPIKVRAILTNPNYKDEAFVTLYCRKPPAS